MTIKPVTVLFNRENELKKYKNFLRSSSDEDFEARCNETDHFIFICSKCRKYALVISVELEKLVDGPIGPVIRFELWCKSCGLRGQRKIYLKGDLQPQIPIEEPYDDEDDPDL